MAKMVIEHNPRHYTTINILGEKFNACSRCLGSWSAGLISFFVFGLIHYLGFSFEFWHIFSICWIFASFTIIDWTSAKLNIWVGNGKVRIVTGMFLGISVSMWFWLLPIPLFQRLLSLVLIEAVFGFIVFVVNYHEMRSGMFDVYNDFYEQRYSKIMCLGCCDTVCCMGPKICCYASLALCCCCCPLLICLIMKKGGG